MLIASKYNIIVPLNRGRDSSYQEESYFALFNLLAGSIDIVDSKVCDALCHSQMANRTRANAHSTKLSPTPSITSLAPDVIDYLDRRGYLFDSYEQEQAQARMLYTELLHMHRKITRQPIIVIPTYKCDLKCPYCWQRFHHMDSPIMSEEVMNRMFEAIPQVLEQPPEKGVDFVIFGGEPLQEITALRERVSQIIGLANKAGYVPRIISNGVGLASSVPMLEGRVGLIQITIDGPASLHRQRRPLPGGDSFEPMVHGITRALKAGIRINIRVNTDHKNLPLLPELSDFARQCGWLETGLIQFHIAPVKNHNPRRTVELEPEILQSVLDLVSRDQRMSIYKLDGFAGLKYFDSFKATGLFPLHRFFHCEAQINFFAFDLHGDIYACWDAAGIKEMAIGKFSPTIEIFPEKLALWRERNAMNIADCVNCLAQPTCGGGCQFLSMGHKGTFHAPSCDSLLEGWIHSIHANAGWLMERAKTGDHAIGFVSAETVLTRGEREFGLLDLNMAEELILGAC